MGWGFFWSLEILYEGIRVNKFKFFYTKIKRPGVRNPDTNSPIMSRQIQIKELGSEKLLKIIRCLQNCPAKKYSPDWLGRLVLWETPWNHSLLVRSAILSGKKRRQMLDVRYQFCKEDLQTLYIFIQLSRLTTVNVLHSLKMYVLVPKQ